MSLPAPPPSSPSPPAPPAPPPSPGLARIALADLLWLLIVNLGILRIAGLLIGGLLEVARGGREDTGSDTPALVAMLALILFQALVILISLRILILEKYGLSWADLGLRPVARVWYRRAVIFGVGMIPVVLIVNAAMPKLLQEPFENPQILALAPAGFSWFALIGMTIMGGIVAPIAEEIAFRGLFYAWLRARMGFGASAFVSALCFAVLHGVFMLIPALTVVGLVLAWLRERCGSVWPAALTHGTFNVVMILSLYLALSIGAGRS